MVDGGRWWQMVADGIWPKGPCGTCFKVNCHIDYLAFSEYYNPQRVTLFLREDNICKCVREREEEEAKEKNFDNLSDGNEVEEEEDITKSLENVFQSIG